MFSPESSLIPNSPRADKVQLHWMLHAFGTASACFGFAAVFFNKEMNGRKHFSTWHSKLGLATMLGLFFAVLGGIAANYTQKLKTVIKAMTTVALATYSNWFHNRMGKMPWVGRICLWA